MKYWLTWEGQWAVFLVYKFRPFPPRTHFLANYNLIYKHQFRWHQLRCTGFLRENCNYKTFLLDNHGRWKLAQIIWPNYSLGRILNSLHFKTSDTTKITHEASSQSWAGQQLKKKKRSHATFMTNYCSIIVRLIKQTVNNLIKGSHTLNNPNTSVRRTLRGELL